MRWPAPTIGARWSAPNPLPRTGGALVTGCADAGLRPTPPAARAEGQSACPAGYRAHVTTAETTASAASLSRQRVAWVVVAVSWGVYLVLQVTGFEGPVRTVVKGTLMATLLAWVVVALGSRAPRWLVAGLAFALLGDVLLDIRFEVGMVGFLAMQLSYIAGFLGLGAWAGLRARWPIGVAYVLVGVGANVALGPHLGALAIPVLIYSTAILTMAALASGVGRRVGVGGALFVISDALIGVDKAGAGFAGRGLIVLLTYLAAQYLIATGWARRVDPDVLVPV
jgi:uncharacterized membrane protein YhhN